MTTERVNIILVLTITTAVILVLAGLIIVLLRLHHRKEILHYQKVNVLESNHEKNLMATQLEIQEQTLLQISREIHDNISLSLTLAKLHLNTFAWDDRHRAEEQLNTSIELLSRSIDDLSNISRSMNSEIIGHQGLIKALEQEIQRIRNTGLFDIRFKISGEPVYLSTQNEILIFRIVQEGFNNIIKHARATAATISMHYDRRQLYFSIYDNGCGFNPGSVYGDHGGKAGLRNMEYRVQMIGGNMHVETGPGRGTALFFNIPF